MQLIEIHNHGPLITSTNYFESEHAHAGKLYVSINAGAFRLLVPRAAEAAVEEMKTGREVLFSRGPWPAMRLPDAIEALFDDGTKTPYALQLSLESFDRVPTPEDVGKEWVCTIWTEPRRGRPHLALQRPAWYRLAPKLPWLKPRVEES